MVPGHRRGAQSQHDVPGRLASYGALRGDVHERQRTEGLPVGPVDCGRRRVHHVSQQALRGAAGAQPRRVRGGRARGRGLASALCYLRKRSDTGPSQNTSYLACFVFMSILMIYLVPTQLHFVLLIIYKKFYATWINLQLRNVQLR